MLKYLSGLLAAFLFASTAVADDPAPFTLTGSATQGGMMLGTVPPGTSVQLNGEPVKVSSDGRFVIGFNYEEPPQATLRFAWPDGATLDHSVAVAQRKYDIQYIEGLPPKKVTPPPEVQARLGRERGMVKSARTVSSDLTAWETGFVWPAAGKVTGVYGSRRVLNGEPRWPHFGLDVAGPVGTEVRAPAAGTVLLAEPDFYFEGGIIIIDHGFGVSSTLFHLQKVEVTPGQLVAQGERIGAMGATGRATGPHVDWRINWHDVRLDPALVVPPSPPGN